jgi:aminoglycoside phosphotransferase family enzyme/predicted kinase
LSDPETEVARWFEARSERAIETACARVFLAADAAFKVKRHVDLGYVDYSTVERRLWAIERELAFNQAAASDIYRAIRRITRTAGGGLELDGPGAVVDYALEMRRFADDAVLAAKPWAIDGALADELGRTVAGFHAKAPLRPEGGLSALAFTIGSNAELLRELAPRLGHDRVEQLIALTEAELERQRPLLARRVAEGFSRHCHGDLHLGNILVEESRPILFDCIEFNDLLSDLDVQYDLAFLLMDLDFRRRRDAGVRVLSAYLDEAARSFPETIWEGLAALPLMLSVRAGVRAHVWAHSGDDDASRAYVDAGIAHLSPAPPRLVAVGGLSGSGKSSFSRVIAPGLGASPGAVVLRTDEVRKRLLKVAPTQAMSDAAYTPEFYNRAYDELIANARALLTAGRAVVLDATFIAPALRARAEQLAKDCGVPFQGVWLDAPVEVLAGRIEGRTGDASDATLQTLHEQIGRHTSEVAWERVDAAGSVEQSATDWAARQHA